MAQSEDITWQDPDDDDYDPRKPEYITPAAIDDVERQSCELLTKQMTQLETLIARREGDSAPKSVQHYERVLAEMRYDARGSPQRTHARMFSCPNSVGQVMPDDVPCLRSFTHARNRSAPAGTCWDSIPCEDTLPKESDDSPCTDDSPCINRVLSGIKYSPGEQLEKRIASASLDSIEVSERSRQPPTPQVVTSVPPTPLKKPQPNHLMAIYMGLASLYSLGEPFGA